MISLSGPALAPGRATPTDKRPRRYQGLGIKISFHSFFFTEHVMTTPEKPRWLDRLENYESAFSLLREAMAIMGARQLTQLETDGVIRRFKVTWETAWKLLKEYLEASGIVLEAITPTSTIHAAFAAKILQESDVWMQALDARNKLSHIYNFEIFETIIEDIRAQYFGCLEELRTVMIKHALNDWGRAPKTPFPIP